MKKTVCVFFPVILLFVMVACAIIPDINIDENLTKITLPADELIIYPDIDDLEFADLDGLIFWFGSGAGAWRTIVKILPDGTFNGYFSDSDAGEIGPNYHGTRYECYFNGRFTSLRKTGNYEYSMKCESLNTESVEEKIIDGVRILPSDPYGFDNADEFSLYLPGKKTSELPAEFLIWSHGFGSDVVLTSYGLYNVGSEQGFIVWPESYGVYWSE